MKDRAEIEKSFDQAQEELRSNNSENSVELEHAQLHQISHAEHERLAILFDLSLDELRDPDSSKRYVDFKDLAGSHSADTSTLTKALQRFEQVVQSPFRTASSTAKAAVSTTYRQPVFRAAMRVVAAPPRSYIAALIIDIGISAIIAACICGGLSSFIGDEFLQNVNNKEYRSMLTYAPEFALFLKLFVLTMIFYSMALLVMRGKTIGLSRNRIKLVSENGAPANTLQKIVRSLLIPLSIVTLSPIASARGKRTISDTISRTVVSKI